MELYDQKHWTKGNKENRTECRKAVNMCYPFGEGKNDSKVNSETVRDATPTGGPEGKAASSCFSVDS